jgi:hypothetical protein
MTIDSQDQVSLSALSRSLPVPGCWAATFAFDRFCWVNQESGWREVDAVVPSWDDVEVFLMEGLEK